MNWSRSTVLTISITVALMLVTVPQMATAQDDRELIPPPDCGGTTTSTTVGSDCIRDTVKSIDLILLDSYSDGSDVTGGSCLGSGTGTPSNMLGSDSSYDWCFEVSGKCTKTVHAETQQEISWWTLILIGNVQVDTSTSVSTELDCEGQYTMTMEHYGGLGLRNAVVTEATQGSSASSQEGASKESCEYLGSGVLVTDSCVTSLEGEWESHRTENGEITSFDICKKYTVYNSPAISLNGLLETQGETKTCFDATSFLSINLV